MATALGTALNRMSIEIDAESERLKQKKKTTAQRSTPRNGNAAPTAWEARGGGAVGGKGVARGVVKWQKVIKGHRWATPPPCRHTGGRKGKKKTSSPPPPPRSSFPPLRRIPFRAFCLFFANSSAGPHFCQGAFRLSVVFVRYSPLGRMAIVFFRGSTEESRKNKKNARNRPFTISRDPLLIAGR